MFSEAKPVWFQGLEEEKNIHAGFRTVFSVSANLPVLLRLTGSSIYRVFLNGEFVQHGPARGPHGFYRVDELDLSHRIQSGDNLIAIEVVGINCHSFAYLNQSSFLLAELTVAGRVVAATGKGGFDALRLPERIQKVERYSFQRPYVEAYRIAPGFDDWRNRVEAEFKGEACEVQLEKALLSRGVALSDFRILPTVGKVSSGCVSYTEKPVDRSGYWWMNDPRYKGIGSFMPEEFERDILQIYQACTFSKESEACGADSYQILDMGTNLTGFIQLHVACERPVRLLAVFDEVLVNGDIDLSRNATLNLAYYELQPGDYNLETIEPYTFRYLKLIVLDGPAAVHQAGLREYANAEACRAEFSCSDRELNQLFEAGRQTFRQNATDLYMDCPGRERAGWLCDSFFTGRVEPLLCGNSKVEHNFIENFALPERFTALPEGMLPMCYPSEHPDGVHIPQWAMWLVLELEEYLRRTGDRLLVDRMRTKVFALLEYFQKFENSDGLLEKLPGWNFVEWSKANELTQDVNYPTNMLYARMLETVAGLYGKKELFEKAQRIHQTVRDQSFNGTFFVDNAVRDASGVLNLSGESTEVCQYYAFFCGTAAVETFPGLWKILLEEFGPDRKKVGLYDTVHPANAFIGYYLRMELLSRSGEAARLLKEMKGYFLSMAQITGTLWEHHDTRASCNHGFASHICVHLIRDVLGLVAIDAVNKTVGIKVPEKLPLDWCCGKIPVADGGIEMEWLRKDGTVCYKVKMPAGWRLLTR
jgi:alpha-L-rhamnosidase